MYIPFDPNTFDKIKIEKVAKFLGISGGIILITDENEYYSDDDELVLKFDDPHEMERPRTYKKIKSALNKIEKLKVHVFFEDRTFNLAIWIHPEADYEPLMKYLKMTGIQFPSCPTQ